MIDFWVEPQKRKKQYSKEVIKVLIQADFLLTFLHHRPVLMQR